MDTKKNLGERIQVAPPVHFIDALAQEIRRVDGSHSMGAGALAESLAPFLSKIGMAPSELPEEDESKDPGALPSVHPWVIGSKEFSDDAARQADFLAGAKHTGLGFELINSRHATIAWQEEANRLLVGMLKEDEAAVRSMWAQDLKRHMDIPAWMAAKGYTGPVKAPS